MNQETFVYKSTLSLCHRKGVTSHYAESAAQSALDEYKRNTFTGKVVDMINRKAREAKKKFDVDNKERRKSEQLKDRVTPIKL